MTTEDLIADLPIQLLAEIEAYGNMPQEAEGVPEAAPKPGFHALRSAVFLHGRNGTTEVPVSLADQTEKWLERQFALQDEAQSLITALNDEFPTPTREQLISGEPVVWPTWMNEEFSIGLRLPWGERLGEHVQNAKAWLADQ